MKKRYLSILTTLMLLTSCQTKNSSNTAGSSDSVSVKPTESISASTDAIVVDGVGHPKFYGDFLAKRDSKTEETSDFKTKGKSFVVGDDNNFKFKPDVIFYNETKKKPTTVDKWNYNIKLESKASESDNYAEVSIEDKTLVDGFNNVECTIDFADGAINKFFKLTVTPKTTTDSISYEFKVVDGYNVYEAKELGYIYNGHEGNVPTDSSTLEISYTEAWNNFYKNNGLEIGKKPTSLIFQNNIDVTQKDLPEEFFLSEKNKDFKPTDSDYKLLKEEGSLKDWTLIYYRKLNETESFDIYGNYFTLNLEKLPLVRRKDKTPLAPDANIVSHATLFFIEGTQDSSNELNALTSSSLNDLYVIGNSQRVEDTTKSGGVILLKSEDNNMVVDNCVNHRLFISYMPNYYVGKMDIKNSKAYNNYNCFIYNWANAQTTIDNCEFLSAGGPAIIQDEVEDGSVMRTPKTVITNSRIESFVSGQEGWFKSFGADTAAAQIAQLSNVLAQIGQKSYTKTYRKVGSDTDVNLFNFVCLNKNGTAEAMTNVLTTGELSIDGKEYKTRKEIVEAITALKPAPLFNTVAADAAGEQVYYDTKNLVSLNLTTTPPTPTNIDPAKPNNHNIFKGEHISIYYNGMMLVLGYYDAGEKYTPDK